MGFIKPRSRARAGLQQQEDVVCAWNTTLQEALFESMVGVLVFLTLPDSMGLFISFVCAA
jgi:hypothetical protein